MADAPLTPDQLFASTFSDGDRFPVPAVMGYDSFVEALLWGKERKVSDFSLRSHDYIRSDVGGGWRFISSRPVSHDEVTEIIKAIDTPTSPASLLKGSDIDRRFAPIQIIKVQDSRVPIRISHRFRINITQIKSPINDAEGFALVIRTLPGQPPTPQQIGLETELYENFHKKNSLGLITGGTGNGKSTLLYSIFRGWVEEGKTSRTGLHILDYCKPIEYVIDDIDSQTFISQTEVGTMLVNRDDHSESGQWQYAGRNAVRRKPDVINIGETRDRPTFDGMLTAANTGHFGTTTMHNNSCPSTLQRGLRFYGHSERLGIGTDLMSFLHCIVNQELVTGRDGRTKFALREYIFINDHVRTKMLAEDNVEKWPGLMHQVMMDNIDLRRDQRVTMSQTKYEHAIRRYEAGEIGEAVVRRMKDQLHGLASNLKTIGAPRPTVTTEEIARIDAGLPDSEAAP